MLKLKDKLYLSWSDIEKYVDKLCKRILLSNIPVNTVHGLKRGGYIPAVMISHQLKLPYPKVFQSEKKLTFSTKDGLTQVPLHEGLAF